MMCRLVIVPAVISIAVLACGLAYGAPSIFGPTGVLLTPNAEVVGRGGLDVGAHFIDLDTPLTGDMDLAAYKATVGLSDRFEVTGAFLSVDNGAVGADQDEFIVHGKYQLVPSRSHGTSVAVGVIDLFEDALGDIVFYGALSRTADRDMTHKRLVRGTVGLAFADNIGGRGDDTEIFASLEVGVSNRVIGLVERFNDDLSFGGRIEIVQRLQIHVASVQAGGDREFLIGGAYHASW